MMTKNWHNSAAYPSLSSVAALIFTLCVPLYGKDPASTQPDPLNEEREPIAYISPDVPNVNLPPYDGERYEAVVPDTLDLAERARLAVRGLTGVTNPEADYEVYWAVEFEKQSTLHVARLQ